ncbi:SseB family protein [Kitasatospora sp. RB6PN24]|uniref:SseB family protein n=1 Tax=Kitasatospora humi TaxID=2893891 RepID=UPI001E5BCAC7|nr:SseB family protein [Kitasatospora humi]MCC9310085.1 SseB family protein [Kitasatospora humi]
MGGLDERLVGFHAGCIDGAAVVDEFRRSASLVPLSGGEPMAADSGGVRWIYAFTSEATLELFATERGLGDVVDYLTVYGARLLDVAVPAAGVPAGVAVDVAGPAPFLLPPVRGIVADAVAVDRG